MIRHTVVFRFVEGTDPSEVEALAAALRELPDTIDGILDYRVGPDLELRDTNAHFAVVADFTDEDAFLVYSAHPDHLEVIRTHVEPIAADRHAVQFRC